jgi:hypothetical protein
MSENVSASPDSPVQFNIGPVIPMEAYAYFGISDPSDLTDPELKRKLNNILAFAYEKTKGEIGDLLLEIRGIENTVGTPDFNMSRHDRVFQYITIQRQINGLEKQKQAFFNTPKPAAAETPNAQ